MENQQGCRLGLKSVGSLERVLGPGWTEEKMWFKIPGPRLNQVQGVACRKGND